MLSKRTRISTVNPQHLLGPALGLPAAALPVQTTVTRAPAAGDPGSGLGASGMVVPTWVTHQHRVAVAGGFSLSQKERSPEGKSPSPFPNYMERQRRQGAPQSTFRPWAGPAPQAPRKVSLNAPSTESYLHTRPGATSPNPSYWGTFSRANSFWELKTQGVETYILHPLGRAQHGSPACQAAPGHHLPH